MSLRTALAAATLCAGLAAAAPAHARGAPGELVEGLDIERRGNEALISIRFLVPIAYSHHTPMAFGKTLRIYPGLARAAQRRSKGRLRLPQTDMVPPFTASFPEPDGALLIEFDQPIRLLDVRPGLQSITITVPVLHGARDWAVFSRNWEASPADPSAGSVQLVGFAGGGNGAFALPVRSMKQVRFGTVVRQQRDWSCGSAAVATLLTYHYSHPVSEAEALEAMFAKGNQEKIRRQGFSLLDIKRYLESLGYRASGFETSLERLARVSLPAIVIINDHGYNHFVVVKGLRHGSVLLGDPAKGNRVVSRSTFDAMWESRIVFVITSRRDGVAFNFSEDWRFMAAPLGEAVGRESLGGMLISRQGPNDF